MQQRAAERTNAAAHRCVPGQGGGGAGPAAGGDRQRGDGSGEGEGGRGRDGGVVVTAIPWISHGAWQTSGTRVHQLLNP